MHVPDILKYGHLTVLGAVGDDPALHATYDTPGACGVWSVRQIVAHLASFEYMLADVFALLADPDAPTPTIQKFFAGHQEFNDSQVAARDGWSWQETIAEYVAVHEQAMAAMRQVPDDAWRDTGRLTWYGPEYDVEDFLVYTFYGHKREHASQVMVFRDTLK